MSDLISRQDAIDSPIRLVKDGFEWIPVFHIKDLPSAQHEITEDEVAKFVSENGFVVVPSDYLEQIEKETSQPRKKGKWVKMTGMMPPEYFGHYECSECGWHLSHHDKTKENELGFCPNCSAEMVKGESDE